MYYRRGIREIKKGTVESQIVVPSLNLALADQTWVRNKDTRRLLESQGFRNVEVKRIPLGY